MLAEDAITAQVHPIDGLQKIGPNAPVMTCLSSWGELGPIPLEAQTVLWFGAHLVSEGSNLLDIPGPGEPSHGVISREDWDICADFASNIAHYLANKNYSFV